MAWGIFNVIMFLLPFLIAGVHVSTSRERMSRKRIVELVMLYFLVINFGIQGVVMGLTQMFMGEEVALYLNWQWSPFLTELGMANLAFGILGLLCYWIRQLYFWLAVGIGYSLFFFLAFWGHLHQILVEANFSWGNIGPVLYTDILSGVVVLALFIMHHPNFHKRRA